MELVISLAVFIAVVAVMICVVLRQSEQIKRVEAAAATKVKAAESEVEALRKNVQTLDTENERLDRENFRLDLEARLRAQYGVCDTCGPKGTHQTLRDDRVPPQQRQRLRNIVGE